jgi:hypothetical protein
VPIRAAYRPRLAEVVPFPVEKLDAPAAVWIERLRPVYRFLEHPLEVSMSVLKFAFLSAVGLVLLLAAAL